MAPRHAHRDRACPRQRGQATVELALVLPLVVFALLAIVQVGLVVRDQVAVVHAAREAARAASVDRDPGAATRAARRVLSRAEVRVGARPAVGGSIGVDVSYHDRTDVPLVGAVFPDVDLHARRGHAGRTVSGGRERGSVSVLAVVMVVLAGALMLGVARLGHAVSDRAEADTAADAAALAAAGVLARGGTRAQRRARHETRPRPTARVSIGATARARSRRSWSTSATPRAAPVPRSASSASQIRTRAEGPAAASGAGGELRLRRATFYARGGRGGLSGGGNVSSTERGSSRALGRPERSGSAPSRWSPPRRRSRVRGVHTRDCAHQQDAGVFTRCRGVLGRRAQPPVRTRADHAVQWDCRHLFAPEGRRLRRGGSVDGVRPLVPGTARGAGTADRLERGPSRQAGRCPHRCVERRRVRGDRPPEPPAGFVADRGCRRCPLRRVVLVRPRRRPPRFRRTPVPVGARDSPDDACPPPRSDRVAGRTDRGALGGGRPHELGRRRGTDRGRDHVPFRAGLVDALA